MRPTRRRSAPVSLDLRPDCPFRRMDWRWARAEQLTYRQGRRQGWDDELVVQSWRFLDAWQRIGGELTGSGLAEQDPAILGAVRLREGSPRRRHEVEARILARQTDQEIGSRLGVPGSVIKAYEGLFYSVRHKLQASDWVMSDVIGPKAYDGLTEGDVDIIWKLWGYHGGPLVLDALIATHDAAHGGSADGLDPELARLCELAIAATVLSASDDAAGALRLDTFLRHLDGLEARNDVAGVTRPVTIASLDVQIASDRAWDVCVGRTPEAPEAVEIAGSEPDPTSESGHEESIRRVG